MNLVFSLSCYCSVSYTLFHIFSYFNVQLQVNVNVCPSKIDKFRFSIGHHQLQTKQNSLSKNKFQAKLTGHESDYVFFLRKLFEKKNHDSNDIDILWTYWKKNMDCDDMNCKPYLKDTDGPGDMHKAAFYVNNSRNAVMIYWKFNYNLIRKIKNQRLS